MLELLQKVFGSQNDRQLKKVRPIVRAVNAIEPKIKELTDDQLRGKTVEFRQKLENGASLADIQVEAFAVVREAATRVLGMRHYDVQIVGGSVLHSGKIAEMKTGEGKTLVATLPVYLNALEGRGVHLVTVNDYLARRDAEWMGQLYRWMGLSVGCILNQMTDTEKQEAYGNDITYGQNNEFGFDYLRDNMKFDLARYVQRELRFAIIDEVDSILIDEARTPLIISGPAEDAGEMYVTVDKLIPKLKKDIHYQVDEKAHAATLTDEGVEYVEKMLSVDNLYDPNNIIVLHHVQNALKAHALYRRDVNYLVRDGQVVIIDEHTGRAMPGRRWSDGLHQAVEAKEGVAVRAENHTLATISFQNYFRLYDKLAGMTGTAKTEEEEFQKIYELDTVVIPTNKPILRADEPDLVYRTERGKFRACIEEIKEANERGQPVLVGTVSVEKSEIIHRMLKAEGIPHEVLNAKHHGREAKIVAQAGRSKQVTVATNMAGRGTDIILGGNAEFAGQSILEEEFGFIRYTELWERVEYFVKQITIGREDLAREMIANGELAPQTRDGEELPAVGEEIISRIAEIRDEFKADQKKVLDAGGLFILGTERHESRRIDNQLRGRAGRQGDPGASRFYLSLEDDLMRIFANDKMAGMMDKLGMSDDQPIEHGMVSKAIENAQRRVEGMHFDSRKNLLEYDDVMNQQRKTIYGLRREVLGADEPHLRELCFDAIEDLVSNMVDLHCPEKLRAEEWNVGALVDAVQFQFNHGVTLDDLPSARPKYEERIYFEVEEIYKAKVAEVNATNDGLMHRLEKDLYLRQIDELWKNHLQVMGQLRQGIGLRGYGQRDPKKEYAKEGFRLFLELLVTVKSNLMGQLFRVQVQSEEEVRRAEEEHRRRLEEQQKAMRMIAAGGEEREGPDPDEVLARPRRAAGTVRRERPKIGRNDPCWCGSGKKYKKCHMQADLQGAPPAGGDDNSPSGPEAHA
jgi:preprotein translocase subunit SecA